MPLPILCASQRVLLLLSTIVLVWVTALSALANDVTTTQNTNTATPTSRSDISLNGYQKKFRKGDTLTSILKESRVVDRDILTTTRLLQKKIKLNKIHVGQTLDLYLHETADARDVKSELFGLILHGSDDLHWTIVRSLTNKLILQKLSKPQALASIHTSLGPKDLPHASAFFSHRIMLGQGDTLTSLLQSSGLNDKDIRKAIKALAPQLDLRLLQVGQMFTLKLQSLNDQMRLVGLTAIGTPSGHITVTLPLREEEAPATQKTNPVRLKKFDTRINKSETDSTATSEPPIRPNSVTSSPSAPDKLYRKELIVLKKGESFVKRLLGTEAAPQDIYNATQALSQRVDFARLPVGQKIQLLFLQNAKTDSHLVSVIISPNSTESLRVNRRKDGTYSYRPLSKDIFVTKLSDETAAIIAHPVAPKVIPPHPDKISIDIIKIMPGDTLENILRRQKVSPKEARLALHGLKEIHNSDNIIAGQTVALYFKLAGEEYKLQKMILGLASNKTVVIEYIEGSYKAYGATATIMKQAIQADQRLESLQADLRAGKQTQTVIENYSFNAPDNTLVKSSSRQPRKVIIREGDTLFDALVNSGVRPLEAEKAISTARKLANPRKLKPGQTLHLFFANATEAIPSEDGIILAELSIDLNVKQRLRVARLLDGAFIAGFVTRPLKTVQRKAEGIIKSSLYEAASRKNVSAKTLAKLIRIFSYDVDFQRDIRKGDIFKIFYEVLMDDGGHIVDSGEILYSSLTLSGTGLSVYKFTSKDQSIDDYFDDQGQSVKKALMRTPIDGARLTSSYGNRKHPTLGYTKMHRGVDFGAPRGTPIFAAGDGVVDKLGTHGAYGNYIRLRHGPVYQTAYAHLHKFASGLQAGKRVKQGDTIGFVGSTGRSTGPHLHYEVLKNGKQVNPLGVKLPSGMLLQGSELNKFRKERQRLLDQFASQN